MDEQNLSTDEFAFDFYNEEPKGTAVIERVEQYTQDNGIVSCDSSRRKEIMEAESFIKSLPELTYYVTKINQWGKHQSRQLRLTSEGIENIRNQTASSMYKYSEVISVSMRNINTFVLQYANAAHDYVYRSPVAMQIVQEISTRISLRRTTDKKKLTYDIALEYQKKLKAEGTYKDVQETDDSDDAPSPTSSPTSFTSSSSSSSSVSSAGSSVSPSSDTEKTPHKKRATKLMKILGTTESQRLQNEVDRLLLSPNMPEGRTVNQFVADFHVLMKSPATAPMNVRRFIDSLRAHIMEKRGNVLSKLIVNDALTDQVSLGLIVELSLEKSVIVRLQKPIFSAIQTQTKRADEQLAARTAQLRYKPQSFFGIPEELQSSNNWSSAVLELSCINRCETPADKNACILAAAKSIYNSAYHDLSNNTSAKKDYYLSADDFLPIYIYVVVSSDIVDIETTNQFLWLLSDPQQLTGESGYYLTVFSSVVSLLQSLDLANIETAHTIEQLMNLNESSDGDLLSNSPSSTSGQKSGESTGLSSKLHKGREKWNKSMSMVKSKVKKQQSI